MRAFTVGTRGSALALWQTRHVSSRLQLLGASITERVITTQGDVDLTERLQGKLEKGFFTRELESELRAGQVDWAVHSLKDLPTQPPPGLVLGAVLERAAANDLLLVHPAAVDERAPLGLKKGARVGSSSLRRENLLRHYAPQCEPVPLRGNVPTRVEKLRAGQFGAVLLAEAGVKRLELDLADITVLRLNPRRWVCAPGQGAVAVQCREDDAEVRALLTHLDHAATNHATRLERDFLRVLEGGCTTPFGCYADGAFVHLGLATPQGWRAARVESRADAGFVWLQTQLDVLTTQPNQEYPDEWLTRRL